MRWPTRTSYSALLLAACALNAAAHGNHAEQVVVAPGADWATRHMAEEHHISAFDPGTFFTLHDYDSTGIWSGDDIRRTYGLFDHSTAKIPEARKAAAVSEVLRLYDLDHDGVISMNEWLQSTANGVRLPDFGFGPGHHGDDEYEYEIHHWEKYHSGDNVREEDLNHPEDIEHFARHEAIEQKQAIWEKMERSGIVEKNIPLKFRVGG